MPNPRKLVEAVEELAPSVKAARAVPTREAILGSAKTRAQADKAIDDLLKAHNIKVQKGSLDEDPMASWEDLLENATINDTQSGRFRQQLEDDAEGIMANIWGRRGAVRAYGEDAFIRSTEAQGRLAAGDNPASVFADTGWYQGVDGKMKFHASEQHIKVNTDRMFNKIRSRHKEKPYKEGDEFFMQVPLGQLLESEGLFKAYPHLKETRVVMSFAYRGKNDAGEDIFQIYNKKKGERGVLGGADYGKEGSPSGTIYVYNNIKDPWGYDMGRSTILHEVQHLIQKYEGFSEGASASGLRNIAEAAAETRLDLKLLDLLEDGKIKEGMSADERAIIIKQMANEFGDKLDNAGLAYKWYDRAIDRAIGKEWDDLNAERHSLQTAWNGYMTDAVLALRMPDQTLDQVEELLNHGPFKAIWDQAYTRYANSGGEVESRIVQLFDGMRRTEFNRLGTARQAEGSEDFVDIISQPVQGGKQNIAVEPGIVPDELPRESALPTATTTVRQGDYYTSQRAAEMEKGENWVNVPTLGGRGKAKVKLLKNPSQSEMKKFQQDNDEWEFRTLRTEEGDLFVWSGYSDALHKEMIGYLGNPKLADKDYYDSADLSDVLAMIKGDWYGNEF